MLPFAIFASLCIWDAARAPEGRRPFQFEVNLSPGAMGLALTKTKHMTVVAVLFLLATLATGTGRLRVAFLITNLVGLTWELAQTTVVGHSARVADLGPNVVVAGACSLIVLSIRTRAERLARGGNAAMTEPPNNELQRTRPAQAMEPRR
jgi:hypothetical protein